MKNIKSYTEQQLKSYILNKEFTPEFKKLLHKHKDYTHRSSSPKKLENDYNITGISYTYKMPYNLTAEEVENTVMIFLFDSEITDILFTELLKLNPVLNIFKKYTFYSRFGFKYPRSGVIGGVCSSMNADDIYDYIENDTEILKFPLQNNGEYKIKAGVEYNKLINILYKNKIEYNWFPSLKTLKDILNKLNIEF